MRLPSQHDTLRLCHPTFFELPLPSNFIQRRSHHTFDIYLAMINLHTVDNPSRT